MKIDLVVKIIFNFYNHFTSNKIDRLTTSQLVISASYLRIRKDDNFSLLSDNLFIAPIFRNIKSGGKMLQKINVAKHFFKLMMKLEKMEQRPNLFSY